MIAEWFARAQTAHLLAQIYRNFEKHCFMGFIQNLENFVSHSAYR
jgi:hypothetical protein